MTQEQEKYLKLLKASFEGKKLEMYNKTFARYYPFDLLNINTHINQLILSINSIRIKSEPEPRFKPYENVNPEWVGKIVKNKVYNSIQVIVGLDLDLEDNPCPIHIGYDTYDFDQFCTEWDWYPSGLPCGEEIE